MITANYTQLMKRKLAPWVAPQVMKSWAGNINSYMEDLYVEDFMSNISLNEFQNIRYHGQTEYRKFFILFGNGTEAMRHSDYRLQSPVSDIDITGLTFVPNSDFDSGSVVASYVVSVVNRTDNPINLSEIGLFGCTRNDGSQEWNDDQIYMFSRDTFPTVTVQPNEYYTFTIAIG